MAQKKNYAVRFDPARGKGGFVVKFAKLSAALAYARERLGAACQKLEDGFRGEYGSYVFVGFAWADFAEGNAT